MQPAAGGVPLPPLVSCYSFVSACPCNYCCPSDATLLLCLAKCGRQLKLIKKFSCAQRLPLQIVRATLKCTAHAAGSSIRPATSTTIATTIAEAGATTSHLKATLTKCQNVKKRDFTQAEMSSRRRCSDKRANRAEQKGERERERKRGQATVQQWGNRAAAARWAMLANKRSVELLLMS